MSRVGWGLRSGERLDLSGNKFYNAVAVENIVRKERERERERERRLLSFDNYRFGVHAIKRLADTTSDHGHTCPSTGFLSKLVDFGDLMRLC